MSVIGLRQFCHFECIVEAIVNLLSLVLRVVGPLQWGHYYGGLFYCHWWRAAIEMSHGSFPDDLYWTVSPRFMYSDHIYLLYLVSFINRIQNTLNKQTLTWTAFDFTHRTCVMSVGNRSQDLLALRSVTTDIPQGPVHIVHVHMGFLQVLRLPSTLQKQVW